LNGASGAPKYFVILGDELFFQARNSDVNQALWKTDGTAGGTVQVLETTLSALPVVWNGKLFFAGNDGLMSSDGTSAGTTVWTSIYPGGPFVVFNNALFMSALHIGVADETGGGRPNYELYSCDATTACALVKDIESGSKGSQPGSLTVFNNKLYFAANGGLGNELWTSDGTADGTVLVKDINPGLGDYTYDGETLQASSSPSRFFGIPSPPPPSSNITSASGLHLRADDAQLIFGPNSECIIRKVAGQMKLISTCDMV